MSKTEVKLHINTMIVERFWKLAEAKNLSPDFLAGVAFSQLLDEFEMSETYLAGTHLDPNAQAPALSPTAQAMTGYRGAVRVSDPKRKYGTP